MNLLHKKTTEQLIEEAEVFSCDLNLGLSSSQVKQRVEEGLTNKTKKRTTKSISKIFIDNFFNPLNVLLLVIFVIMVIGKLPISSFFFMIVLTANSILGLIQDFNARRLVNKLSILSESKVYVLRDGKKKLISTDDLVYGDIAFLSNGDQVTADCRIVEGNCSVNESMLTGESLPINKTEKDTLLSGSFLVSGSIKVIIEKVGSANYIEVLEEKAAQFNKPESEIKKTINSIMIISVIAVLSFALFTTLVYIFEPGKTFSQYAAELSGSSVSMIPSGMYLLTSLTLAVGVVILANKRMLVQQLYCIEMLARVDVVCLDKTGTLTTGDMCVEEIIPVGDNSLDEVKELIKHLIYCIGDGNATNKALIDYLPKDKEYKIAKYIPFNSASKFSAVETLDGSTIAIGAFGFVNSIVDKATEALIQEKSREGYRVICVFKNKKKFKNGELPMLSKLVGLVLISNSIKKDAPRNIKWFQDNEVTIKIISGDNPLTVSHIAELCGVKNSDKYLNCEDLTNDELIEQADKVAVFGRVSPEQKELLINTFKNRKHTVAMTGDGVNDILALKAADCSIAMANGSSAARNVSHIVALDSDFSNLPNVVKEGRRVINNLQRSCSLFLSKTVFAILVSLFFCITYFFTGETYPFITNHMIPWELFSIGFASFLLALQPSEDRLKGSFKANILLKTIPAGVAEFACVIMTYFLVKVCDHIQSGEEHSFITVAVLSFNALSYIVLAKVCWPFDKYRLRVFLVCGACLSGLLAFDYFAPKYYPEAIVVGIDYTGLTRWTIISVLSIVIIGSIIYFVLCDVFDRLVNKLDKGTL